MGRKSKRVAVIGLDAAMHHLIDQFIPEGVLPNFKKLFEGGMVADNCMAPFPTITPPNWTGIATGAFSGTHGITDFHYQLPDSPPDNRGIRADFNSERVQAETIWEALDKAGEKCIVFNYPCSWPSRMKNGIMVGGKSMQPTETRDGLPGLDAHQSHLLRPAGQHGDIPPAHSRRLPGCRGLGKRIGHRTRSSGNGVQARIQQRPGGTGGNHLVHAGHPKLRR